MARELEIRWCGVLPYAEALELQEKRVEAVRSDAAGEALFLLEHPSVVTLGRRSDPAHLLAGRAALAARGVEVHEIARGGDVTWHGPGQLVGYAVLDLAARGRADAHAFLRDLEGVLIAALAELGVRGMRRPGYTGVYVAPEAGAAEPPLRPRKIASIGIGLRGWVSFHGFALNVDCDLSGFDAIVPCGLREVAMTSVARELGASAPGELAARARGAVARAFTADFR